MVPVLYVWVGPRTMEARKKSKPRSGAVLLGRDERTSDLGVIVDLGKVRRILSTRALNRIFSNTLHPPIHADRGRMATSRSRAGAPQAFARVGEVLRDRLLCGC